MSGHSKGSAVKLNPLSTSKGQKYLCELCGKVATLACQHCRVTYYCSREHQSVDWFGIHEKICQLLGALRTLRSTLGSEDERQRRQLTVQMAQHALIDLCKNEAQKHLVQGQFELAIPGALQSLRFSIDVYGAGRIELVPAYLLLAESNLGLRRLRAAEEFLLYANWSVLKNPECTNELKAQLCRNFGKLYACQRRFDDALFQLAQDVYYSSLENGPEHVDTAGGYFYMADVFLMRGDVESGLSFFDKVVDIWYKFLIGIRHKKNELISDYLSEASIAEAIEMLRTILETRKKHLGAHHVATAETAYALGILKVLTGHENEAIAYYSMALNTYMSQLGPSNEATLTLQEALNELTANRSTNGEDGGQGREINSETKTPMLNGNNKPNNTDSSDTNISDSGTPSYTSLSKNQPPDAMNIPESAPYSTSGTVLEIDRTRLGGGGGGGSGSGGSSGGNQGIRGEGGNGSEMNIVSQKGDGERHGHHGMFMVE